jgi:TRAP-type C4-dicarboxylate transport system permease small subunit
MKRILAFIDDKFEEIIGVTVLGVVVTLIFLGVVLRLIFTSGLPWQEELSRFGFVFVCYLGASYGIKSKDHIRITFVADALPKGVQKVLRVITDIVWIGFNIFIVIISLNVYQHMRNFRGESGILKIPLHYVFLTIPVGFALLTLRLIQQYIIKLIKPRTGVETDSHTDQAETER